MDLIKRELPRAIVIKREAPTTFDDADNVATDVGVDVDVDVNISVDVNFVDDNIMYLIDVQLFYYQFHYTLKFAKC